jgi:hypothetical protein
MPRFARREFWKGYQFNFSLPEFVKKHLAVREDSAMLAPVLGGTAGRRSIRCGGLQLFRGV